MAVRRHFVLAVLPALAILNALNWTVDLAPAARLGCSQIGFSLLSLIAFFGLLRFFPARSAREASVFGRLSFGAGISFLVFANALLWLLSSPVWFNLFFLWMSLLAARELWKTSEKQFFAA